MTVRSLGLTSNSRKTICCQVPRVSFLSRNGTDKSGPIMEARICECPLPSCHLFSCSYDASLGANLLEVRVHTQLLLWLRLIQARTERQLRSSSLRIRLLSESCL